MELLHGLGEHVGGRVAQHGEAVLAVDGHGLDDVAVGEHVEEVAQLAVDAGHDDGAASPSKSVAGRRLLRDRSLASGDGDGDLCRHEDSGDGDGDAARPAAWVGHLEGDLADATGRFAALARQLRPGHRVADRDQPGVSTVA